MQMVVAGDNAVMISPEERQEASVRIAHILACGEQIDDIQVTQMEHIKWLTEDINRLRSQGYDSLLDFVKNPDISKALWGRTITTTTDAYRLKRYLELQFMFEPEERVNVLELLPKSVAATGMLTIIEDRAAQLPPPGDPNRANAVQSLTVEMEAVGQRKYRENLNAAKPVLQNVFTYDAKSGIVSHSGTPLLKLNPKAGLVAATVLQRIIPTTISSLRLGPDELTAWVDNQPVTVGHLLTEDNAALNALADIIHAIRE